MITINPRKARGGVAAIGAMALCVTMAACGSDSDSKSESKDGFDLVKSGQLTLVTSGNLPPFTSYDKSGKLIGYDLDLGEEVARRIGLKLNPVTVDFTAELQGLQQGQYDLADGGIHVTPERQEQFIFTAPVASTGAVALTTEENASSGKVTGIESIDGLKVGSVSGSATATYVTDNKSTLKYDSLQLFPGIAEAVLAMQAGRIDLIAIDNLSAGFYVESAPNGGKLSIVGDPADPSIIAMALRKDETKLQKAIDGALKEMYSDGYMAKIQTEWFGAPQETPTSLDQPQPWSPPAS